MSKLKIEKIKLQDLSKEEQKLVQGGGELQNDAGALPVSTMPSIVTAHSVLVCQPGEPDKLTDRPGFQDSCGICTAK